MALGAVEVSPIEMASAYAAFSNGGYRVQAYGIERVRTAAGKMLYDKAQQPSQHAQVIGSPALQYMNMMMRQVLASGTGTRARISGYDIAGKTGTTSDYRDAWFVGFTGGFVTAVWTGRDDNTPMRKVTGGGIPAALWRAFMVQALPRLHVSAIPGGDAPPPTPDQAAGIDQLLNGALGGANGEGEPIQAPPPDQPKPAAPAASELY
jgi:penicillin-binding protein 1A